MRYFLGQSQFAKWEVRCSPWPIEACHGDGEVEEMCGGE